MKKGKDYLTAAVILLLITASLAGVLSMDFSHAHNFVNQYGQKVSLYGYGIYANDTYFKAPISIGTDLCILFMFVPMFIYTYVKYLKKSDAVNELKMISVYGVSLYYSASIAFGLTYNRLFLVYTALFACSLFGMFIHIRNIKLNCAVKLTRGIKILLLVLGIALFVAWFPDIIPSLINGGTLSQIGVYTTEITYIIDMGIIAPICFISIYLLSKKDSLGTIMMAVIMKLGMVIGVMMITQSACQVVSNADMPIGAVITKAGSFVVLSIFAYYFNNRMYKEISENIR